MLILTNILGITADVVQGLTLDIVRDITFGSAGGAPTTFNVLDSDGNSFNVPLAVLNSSGASFTVPSNVLDSDGNSFAAV